MARRKKRRTAAQRRATAKLVAANRARARKKKARRTTRRRTTTRRKTAKRKTSTRRRTVARRRRTTKRRRRSSGSIRLTRVRGQVYRKNPRFTVRSLLNKAQRGVVDAGKIIGGKVAARTVANFLPMPKAGMMNYVTQSVAALAVGLAAQQFFSPDTARMVLAGGFLAPAEAVLKMVPVVGPMLGDDYLELGEYGLGYDPYLPVGDTDPFLPIGEYGMEGGEYPQEADYEYM